MSYDINVIYPQAIKKSPPTVLAAAQQNFETGKVDLKAIESDLSNLLKLLDTISSGDTKYEVDEVKLSIGAALDSEGKLKVGLLANLLSLFSAEVSAEQGEKLSSNQLFEITIKRK